MTLDSSHGREENATPERVRELIFSGEREELWLGTGEQYPALAILTSGSDAHVTYFRDEGEMWVSSGDSARCGETVAVTINGTPDEVDADFCVTREKALGCALAFFGDMYDLPGCIEWEEL